MLGFGLALTFVHYGLMMNKEERKLGTKRETAHSCSHVLFELSAVWFDALLYIKTPQLKPIFLRSSFGRLQVTQSHTHEGWNIMCCTGSLRPICLTRECHIDDIVKAKMSKIDQRRAMKGSDSSRVKCGHSNYRAITKLSEETFCSSKHMSEKGLDSNLLYWTPDFSKLGSMAHRYPMS